MSSYFDFTVERLKDGKRIDIANSWTDCELAVINPYVLKALFWESGECSFPLSSHEKEASIQTIRQFGRKIKMSETEMKEYPYDKTLKRESWNIVDKKKALDWLEKISESESKFDDIALYFSNKEKNKRKKFSEELGCNKFWSSVFFDGFLWKEGAWSLHERLKYDPSFEDGIGFERIGLVSYWNNENENVKQWVLEGNVSDKEDLEIMARHLTSDIENAKRCNESAELAKREVKEILDEFEGDDSEIYKRFKEFCGGADGYYDLEYIDELKAQLDELRLLIHFVGDDGILCWNIQ